MDKCNIYVKKLSFGSNGNFSKFIFYFVRADKLVSALLNYRKTFQLG